MAYRSFNPANVELHPYAHWSGKERKPISLPPASARRSDCSTRRGAGIRQREARRGNEMLTICRP
jgi:hypothetical protein